MSDMAFGGKTNYLRSSGDSLTFKRALDASLATFAVIAPAPWLFGILGPIHWLLNISEDSEVRDQTRFPSACKAMFSNRKMQGLGDTKDLFFHLVSYLMITRPLLPKQTDTDFNLTLMSF